MGRAESVCRDANMSRCGDPDRHDHVDRVGPQLRGGQMRITLGSAIQTVPTTNLGARLPWELIFSEHSPHLSSPQHRRSSSYINNAGLKGNPIRMVRAMNATESTGLPKNQNGLLLLRAKPRRSSLYTH